MKKKIIFKLNDCEKIILESYVPLEEINHHSRINMIFEQDKHSYTFSNDDVLSLQDNLKNFTRLLLKALSNELQIHSSLIAADKKDIGYFFNESRQNKSGLFYDDNEYWVGMRFMLQGTNNFVAWIYNRDGTIIFEITPNFPGETTYWFQQEPFSKEEISNSAWYDEWIKDYKPILIRVIPREIAQEWLDQANNLLHQIEENMKNCR